MEQNAAISAESLALLDAAACGLLQTDADGLILWVNQPFCEWVGHEKTGLIGKRKLQELFTMGGRIFHQTHWAPLLQMQGSISEVKLELQQSDGQTIPVVLNAIRREQDGRIRHDVAAFIARDRDAYERELVKSREGMEKLVKEAERLKALAEQMVAIVSHDLRNPLSVVKLSALLLAKGNVSPQQGRLIERMNRANERAIRLINDLLDFSLVRLGNGLAVTMEHGNLHGAVADAVNELKLAYPERAIFHEASGDGLCSFDTDRLAQVVGNLLSNAVTYGQTHASITVRSMIEATSYTVSVHNEGPPIPHEVQANIFEPMVRGAGTSTANHNMGLGLFIAHQIIKAHGGLLFVNSTKELGTQFTALVPRRDAAASS